MLKVQMAKGGMMEKKPFFKSSSVAQKILAKKMAEGGMVEEEHEDFLSANENDEDLDLTYPDSDHMEDTEGMGEEEDEANRSKRILSKIFSR